MQTIADRREQTNDDNLSFAIDVLKLDSLDRLTT